ncbi:MAG: hypothetical protein ACXVAY_04430 [Mucilaginibacter sp.]
MNEPFIIPIIYQETEYEFKARFERWGYTHRIAVLIGETTFTFEPDEEGGYLTLAEKDTGNVNVGLLRAVAEKLAKLVSANY